MLGMNYWGVLILSLALNLTIVDNVNSSEVDQAQINKWSKSVGLILVPAENPEKFGTFFVCESETGIFYGITTQHTFLPKEKIDSLDEGHQYTTATAFYRYRDTSMVLTCNISQSFPDYDVVNFYPDSKVFENTSPFETFYSKFSDLDSATDIRLLDEVIYFGFPHGLGASFTGKRNDPVVRKTVISYISTDGNHFLIQSLSGKGSSGSPVFSLRTNKLVGMVVAAYKGTDLTEVLRADRIRKLLKR